MSRVWQCLIHKCDMPHPTRVIWLLAHTWHDSLHRAITRVIWLIQHMWHASPHTCDMTPHTHVTWLNTQGYRRTLHSFTWLSHVTCAMTHSHVWHDSSHTCDTTHYTGLSPYQRYICVIYSCHMCHELMSCTCAMTHSFDSLHRAIAVSKVHRNYRIFWRNVWRSSGGNHTNHFTLALLWPFGRCPPPTP